MSVDHPEPSVLRLKPDVRWGGVLAAMEEQLMAQVAYIAADGSLEEPDIYLPPDDLPPIPPAFLPRARALLTAIETVEHDFATERARVAAELAGLPRIRSTRSIDPEHLDTRV